MTSNRKKDIYLSRLKDYFSQNNINRFMVDLVCQPDDYSGELPCLTSRVLIRGIYNEIATCLQPNLIILNYKEKDKVSHHITFSGI